MRNLATRKSRKTFVLSCWKNPSSENPPKKKHCMIVLPTLLDYTFNWVYNTLTLKGAWTLWWEIRDLKHTYKKFYFQSKELMEWEVLMGFKGNLGGVQRVRSNKMEQSFLVESHKLDPRILDWDLKPIQANLRWHLHSIILFGRKFNWVQTKKRS